MREPVLLLGAGTGLATSGLLYLASYLRQHGVEAYARPLDTAPSLAELERRTVALLERVRPRLVGISLKWFLHLHRGIHLARVVKAFDPDICVVLGGDTASHYYQELVQCDGVDAVVRGDGEAPLLALTRDLTHPNVWRRGQRPAPLRSLGNLYAQRRDADDSSLEGLDSIFLCEADRYYVPPFVVGGKGCSQGCLYCGGARSAQQENFGRPRSFMRPIERVRADVVELMRRAYTLVYDFSDHPLADPSVELERLWTGLDLSRSGILYYAWRVPPPKFVELLSRTHESVTLGLDFGCFSERQRRALGQAHALKPLPDDREFLELIELTANYSNVKVRVSGVAGLPGLTLADLEQEAALIERVLSFPQVEDVLWDLVHAQPGAPLLESLERFAMSSPVHDFGEFLEWSREHAPNGQYRPPLLAHTGPAAIPGDPNQRIAAHHQEMHARIDTHFAGRKRDGARFETFDAVATRRFLRRPEARVLNRYNPRDWWLDFERPQIPESELDEPMARVVIGHVWQDEFGAISIPAVLVDSLLSAFDSAATGEEARAAMHARGVSLQPKNLAGVIRFFYERGLVDPV
nr:hypothetical protein Hi04_10k_c5591_00013 [uncultured bacterium]